MATEPNDVTLRRAVAQDVPQILGLMRMGAL
jgi:hypothetical protein